MFSSRLHRISIRLIALRNFVTIVFRTRFARCTWIQGIKMQTNVRDNEKKGNATKWSISSHFYIELMFCLHEGWNVENAVQHLWKCVLKECWRIHATMFLSRLHRIFIRPSEIQSTVLFLPELVLLDARERKEPRCRQVYQIKKRKGTPWSDAFLRTFKSNQSSAWKKDGKVESQTRSKSYVNLSPGKYWRLYATTFLSWLFVKSVPYSFMVVNNSGSVYVHNFYPSKFYSILIILFKVLYMYVRIFSK